MTVRTKYMTRNDCYKAGRKIVPKGIMIHSTATPGVKAAAWFSRWNKSYRAGEMSRQVCVHAFVDDKESWQYLPWNHRGWHAGGAANNTHIGIELCEPGGFRYRNGFQLVGYDASAQERYFRAVWRRAVDLCVLLCEDYGFTASAILDHTEGHRQGVASNSADVGHWFSRHGESVVTFRRAVSLALAEKGAAPVPQKPQSKKLFKVQAGAFSTEPLAKRQVNRLKQAGFEAFVIKDA
ncbi:N-acetylmuramoyl-L-alanine amidase [Salisediminibacterium beveridgei]|uniref:N-acetylmuramoyl-L-alanine amidase n=1 Tax=Salisediminibacterium beveridgei TaxID=632773 RepID=UPI000847FC32|nr:N-acetylmuramoyl-L-alanine amidase [Salisediminibacterium beveridgei]